jgi:hypothetical protein
MCMVVGMEATTATDKNLKNKIMKNLPFTISEIINCAASAFNDSAVISVNVNTSYGEVTVMRDGTVKMAN